MPEGRECEQKCNLYSIQKNMIYLLGCLCANKGHNLVI